MRFQKFLVLWNILKRESISAAKITQLDLKKLWRRQSAQNEAKSLNNKFSKKKIYVGPIFSAVQQAQAYFWGHFYDMGPDGPIWGMEVDTDSEVVLRKR